jgi:phage terminase large subunit-like protein
MQLSSPVLSTSAAALAPPPAGVVFDVEAWALRTARSGDYFDERAAEHACQFFPRFLRHTKGEWAGRPFQLEGWQRAIVRTVFGWMRADGTRRFRVVYLEVARKNGKTALAAGIALYLAFSSGELGAEVYCAASNEDQAMICFNEAKRMRSQSPVLRERTNAFKKNMSATETFSKLEVLTSKSDTKDGLNVSGLVGDEFHAWKDQNLYDVLHTATGARLQPLEFYITTAGLDQDGICAKTRQHALEVRDGVADDHEFLPVIFAADRDDPIDDPRTWAKANPNLGVSIKTDYLAKEAKKAQQLPHLLNAFKRLHLNIWTEAETVWIPQPDWDACALRPVTLDTLAGRRCYAGLDLSATTDLTAIALAAEPQAGSSEGADDVVDLFVHCFMPAARLAKATERDRADYQQWVDAGLITLTEGDVVDYDVIRAALTGTGGDSVFGRPLAELVHLVDLASDPWNATHLRNQLMADGLTVVDFRQGFATMSPASKEWEARILSRRLNHGGNKLLRWMNRGTAVVQDPAGNIKPVKPDRKTSTKRIDGVVAGIMALARLVAAREPEVDPFVFEGGKSAVMVV